MKKVLLLLCRGVEIYEAAAFYDVLGWSGVFGAEAVEVVTAGLQKELQGTFGIKIIPDRLLPVIDAEDFDALAIPGGFEADTELYRLLIICFLLSAACRWPYRQGG